MEGLRKNSIAISFYIEIPVKYWRIYKIERKKQSSAHTRIFRRQKLIFFQKLFLIKLREGNWISRWDTKIRVIVICSIINDFFPTTKVSRVLQQQYDSCWDIFVTFQRQNICTSRGRYSSLNRESSIMITSPHTFLLRLYSEVASIRENKARPRRGIDPGWILRAMHHTVV